MGSMWCIIKLKLKQNILLKKEIFQMKGKIIREKGNSCKLIVITSKMNNISSSNEENIMLINKDLVILAILPKFSEIPDFREQFEISKYLINL